MKKKVTVVGAGFVGSTCARRIVEADLANVVLIDIVEGLSQGKALDLMESAPVLGFGSKITGTNNYSDTANSDVVVITAGLARKPGMSRDDLLKANADIVGQIVKRIVEFSPSAILVVVTNPLDVMSYLAYKLSGFDSRKVIGMAGILDSARYRYFISQALSVLPSKVEALVLGGHGDLMVPLASYSTVEGKPVSELLSEEKIEEINERTKRGGAEIVSLLKNGSAYYAPSASAAKMVESILLDEDEILPCSAYLNGEYGIDDVYCGVPVRLSSQGLREIVEVKLTEQEKERLYASSQAIKENIKKVL